MISDTLKNELVKAADRYETAEFIPSDPVQFPHRFSIATDIEIVGLLTALISFGNRKQILAKAEKLCGIMGDSPTAYIKERRFEEDFKTDDTTSFYRMISHSAFRAYLEKLYGAYAQSATLEVYLSSYQGSPMQKLCGFLGVSPQSPQKKINMFLRWMVRDNSPVDFGLWQSFNKSELVIPLDVHVVHTARKLGITANDTYSLTAAKHITATLAEAFPGDPVRGDFALFGLGVNNDI